MPAARTQAAEVQVDLDQVEGIEEVGEVDEVTRPSDLGFAPKEVVVQPVAPPSEIDQSGMVQIRMARTIEEFTYGNPHVHFPLQEGKVYRMPVHVARYLWGIGALSNIA